MAAGPNNSIPLRDLDAHFVGEWTPTGKRYLESVDGAQGIMFQCPKCALGLERGHEEGRGFVMGAHYVVCWFRNPRGAQPVPDSATPGPGRWNFAGETIDSISFVGPGAASVLLTPSGPDDPCGWHGFIRNGEATLG